MAATGALSAAFVGGASITWYAAIATSKTLLTKAMFSSGDIHFPYPLFYSALSCAVTAVAIVLGALCLGRDEDVLRVLPRK